MERSHDENISRIVGRRRLALASADRLRDAANERRLRAGAPPPPGAPSQIVATWRPDVYYAADPAHGGVERPTLFGRVYLFGPELGFPMTGDGKLVVDLYEGAVPHGATGTQLEEWRFDPATLKGLLKRDMIGWGYTIPLPWSTYRADVTTVVLKARYEPTKGAPLFAEGAPMAVHHPDQETGGPVVTESAKPRG